MSASFDAKYIKFSGTGGGSAPQQNLILYSEDLTNAAWVDYPDGVVTVTANQVNDLNGQLTIDQLVIPNYFWLYQNVTSNISTSTDYVISFEVSGTSDSSLHIQVEDPGDSSLMLDTAYGASLTGTVQRLSYEFTTEGTLSSGIRVTISTRSSGSGNQTINVGRIHLYQGNIGDKSYVTTTSSQVV